MELSLQDDTGPPSWKDLVPKDELEDKGVNSLEVMCIDESTSEELNGDGVKATTWDLEDPELENRFEGGCVECKQLGKFNKVSERCNCSGIMVIQLDHMILERERLGKRN